MRSALRRLGREQRGFTLIELIVTMIILAFIMAGLANILTSGSRAASDATARMTGQQNVHVDAEPTGSTSKLAAQRPPR